MKGDTEIRPLDRSNFSSVLGSYSSCSIGIVYALTAAYTRGFSRLRVSAAVGTKLQLVHCLKNMRHSLTTLGRKCRQDWMLFTASPGSLSKPCPPLFFLTVGPSGRREDAWLTKPAVRLWLLLRSHLAMCVSWYESITTRNAEKMVVAGDATYVASCCLLVVYMCSCPLSVILFLTGSVHANQMMCLSEAGQESPRIHGHALKSAAEYRALNGWPITRWHLIPAVSSHYGWFPQAYN